MTGVILGQNCWTIFKSDFSFFLLLVIFQKIDRRLPLDISNRASGHMKRIFDMWQISCYISYVTKSESVTLSRTKKNQFLTCEI